MRKELWFILLAGALCAFPAYGSWVAAGPGSDVGISKMTSDAAGLTLEVTLSGFQAERTQTPGGEFTRISLPGAGISGDLGKPTLPVIRKFVEVPYGAQVSLEVTALERRSYSLAELGLPSRIVPGLPPVPKIQGAKQEFSLDEASYQRDAYAPLEIGAVTEPAFIRAHRVVVLELSPVSYNPAQGKVVVTTRMRVALRFSGGNLSETQRSLARYRSVPFEQGYRGLALNGDVFEKMVAMVPPLPIGYLILVDDADTAAVKPLAAWKAKKGFSVTVTRRSQIPGGSDTAHVHQYLYDAYHNWPIPPTFVLFAGGTNVFPCYIGSQADNPPTDLYFACVQGSDYFPDIHIGRFPKRASGQLDVQVEKTVDYERVLWANGDTWAGKAYFMSSDDGGYHQVAESTNAYCQRVVRRHAMIADSLAYYYNTGTPVATAVNDGRAFVIYTGHGSETSWAGPPFSMTDVSSLTNADKYAFVAGHCCLTGNYNYSSTSFSEQWVIQQNKGSLIYWGSSVTSYWDEDDILQRRMFDVAFDSSLTWVGGMTDRAKYLLYLYYSGGGRSHRYYEEYNVLGDPSVNLYIMRPRTMTVTHPAVVPIGPSSLPVSVAADKAPLKDALVCAMKASTKAILATGYTDNAGNVTLNINPGSVDTVYVTVTSYNCRPYEGFAMARSSGAYVGVLRTSINDPGPGGNGDGIINPGETVYMPTWVKNFGTQPANNVVAKLRSTCSQATVLDSSANCGNIAAGDSFYINPGFRFLAVGSCTNGVALTFNVVCKDVNDSTWTSPVSKMVGTAVLGYESYWTADANHRLDPGDSTQMRIVLRNSGFGNGYNVRGTLRCADSRITITDSVGTYGTIVHDTTGVNDADRYTVKASSAIPKETPIPFVIHLVADGGYIVDRSFTIVVGTITAEDPIGPDPYGYYAYESTDTLYLNSPTYTWIELNPSRGGNGTTVGTGGDDVTYSFPLTGVGVKHYGTNFTTTSVCSNGWLSMGTTTSAPYTNAALPSTSFVPNGVAAFWDDLSTSSPATWWYRRDAAQRFIAEWDSVPHLGGSIYNTFEIIVYDTILTPHTAPTHDSEIILQWKAPRDISSMTVGQQNTAMNVGLNCYTDGTYDRGMGLIVAGKALKFTTDPPRMRGVGVELEVASPRALPTAYGLFQSRPNPLTNRALIGYALPKDSRVALRVYNVSGQMVRELVNTEEKAGWKEAAWDGRDAKGHALSSGVYFYRLEASGYTATKKLVIVR
jgi:hypothetical protein